MRPASSLRVCHVERLKTTRPCQWYTLGRGEDAEDADGVGRTIQHSQLRRRRRCTVRHQLARGPPRQGERGRADGQYHGPHIAHQSQQTADCRLQISSADETEADGGIRTAMHCIRTGYSALPSMWRLCVPCLQDMSRTPTLLLHAVCAFLLSETRPASDCAPHTRAKHAKV